MKRGSRGVGPGLSNPRRPEPRPRGELGPGRRKEAAQRLPPTPLIKFTGSAVGLNQEPRASLEVQGVGLCAPPQDTRSIPDPGTRILHATGQGQKRRNTCDKRNM